MLLPDNPQKLEFVSLNSIPSRHRIGRPAEVKVVMNQQEQQVLQAKWDKFRRDLKTKIGEKYDWWGMLLILNNFESNTRKIVINCGNTYLYKRAKEHHNLMQDLLGDETDLELRHVPFSPGAGLKNIGEFTVPSAKPKKETKKQIKLPECSESQWFMPAIYARSALFGIVEDGKRKKFDNELIPCWSGYEMLQTGIQLTQKDFDVYLEILYRARYSENYRFDYASYDFLKSIGRTMKGGKNHKLLDYVFTILSNSYVVIRKKNDIDNIVIYAGKLIDLYQRPVGRSKGTIAINPGIINLFGNDYVRIDREFRKGLKTDLQKWQYSYLRSQKSSKKNPHQINLKKIQPYTGSIDKQFRRFRTKFKKAVLSFAEITTICDVKNDVWKIVRK